MVIYIWKTFNGGFKLGKYSLIIIILVLCLSGCSKDKENNGFTSTENENNNYSTSIDDESISTSNNDHVLEDEEEVNETNKELADHELFLKLSFHINNMGKLVTSNKELLEEIHLGNPSKDTKKEYQTLLSEFEDERNELSKSVEEISKIEDLDIKQKKNIQENTNEFSESLYMYLKSTKESYLDKVYASINNLEKLNEEKEK